MAYNKRTWLGRQGTGLNKFSIGGATPVTIVNQPDSVTQVGDALSAGNLNDLEDRIEDAFDDVDTALDTKADEQDVTNLNNAINQIDHRVQNLEQAKGSYVVQNYKDGSITPSGKGAWSIVEGLRGVSRVENNAIDKTHFQNDSSGVASVVNNGDGTLTVTISDTTTDDIWLLLTENSGDGYFSMARGHVFVIADSHKFPTGVVYWNAYGGGSLGVNALNTQPSNFEVILLAVYIPPGTTAQSFTIEPVIRDLTLYFGGTIPSDADTIAEIQQNYPHLLIPSEYGVRIVDSSYSGVRAWSRNLAKVNPEYYDSSYVPTFDADKCYKVTAGVTYYWKIFEKTFTTWRARIFFYDMEGNPLTTPSTSWVTEVSSNGFYVNGQGLLWGGNGSDTTKKWTFSQNFYIRFVFLLGDTTSSSVISKFCFNVTDSMDGTFTEYFTDTLALSFQGKSAGSVADTCEPNVEVEGVARRRDTQRVKSYTFTGNETWTYVTTYDYPVFYCAIFTDALYAYNLDLTVMTDEYVAISNRDYYAFRTNDLNKKCCMINNQGFPMFAIQDSAITSGSAMASHMAGKTIHYALAEDIVTLSDPIIDNTLLTESGGRMATVQTGTVVDGSFDMGFITL